jgi:hypothetical protein
MLRRLPCICKPLENNQQQKQLLQKSNEMNEAEFKTSQPEIYDFKMKLLEAQNTISRLKGQLQQQTVAQ